MCVHIPGLGILRRTKASNGPLMLELEGSKISLRPEDILPNGERASIAVWRAALQHENLFDETHIDALVQFILKGM
jgi:hypothetical protein